MLPAGADADGGNLASVHPHARHGGGERAREREKEREGEKEREKEREQDRERKREGETERERKGERERETESERDIERESVRAKTVTVRSKTVTTNHSTVTFRNLLAPTPMAAILRPSTHTPVRPSSVPAVTCNMLQESKYGGTSLIRNTPLLGPYSRTMLRVLERSQRGGRFLMGEVSPVNPNRKRCYGRSTPVNPNLKRSYGRGTPVNPNP